MITARDGKREQDLAEKLKANDEIYAQGDKGVNVIFCDKLELVKKADLRLDEF